MKPPPDLAENLRAPVRLFQVWMGLCAYAAALGTTGTIVMGFQFWPAWCLAPLGVGLLAIACWALFNPDRI